MQHCEINLPSGSALIAYGIDNEICINEFGSWEEIDQFIANTHGQHRFILLSYELGETVFSIEKETKELLFPKIHIWTAQSVYLKKESKLAFIEGVSCKELETKYNQSAEPNILKEIVWKPTIYKEEYFKKIQYIQQEIQYGNVYEMNFCQLVKGKYETPFSPFDTYNHLKKHNPTPFSVFLENDKYAVISASPERYLKKEKNRIFSQPIKGTAKTSVDPIENEKYIKELKESKKERAENVMIVDLVRNDLSKIAQKNSVQVDELCKIYSFPTVHQMISTISCELKKDTLFSAILRATFPMGSMTGAPKLAAMKLAEKTENFNRDLYAGSIGYMLPNGDFDLNVLIRSLFVDKSKKELFCPVGGAITIQSNPESEYDECLTKVERILNLFGTCHFQ